MEPSQNSQAYTNSVSLFCLLFHVLFFQFHMRHMYISKYNFFVIYLWVEKNSHFLKNLTLFLEGIGIFQYREVCDPALSKPRVLLHMAVYSENTIENVMKIISFTRLMSSHDLLFLQMFTSVLNVSPLHL